MRAGLELRQFFCLRLRQPLWARAMTRKKRSGRRRLLPAPPQSTTRRSRRKLPRVAATIRRRGRIEVQPTLLPADRSPTRATLRRPGRSAVPGATRRAGRNPLPAIIPRTGNNRTGNNRLPVPMPRTSRHRARATTRRRTGPPHLTARMARGRNLTNQTPTLPQVRAAGARLIEADKTAHRRVETCQISPVLETYKIRAGKPEGETTSNSAAGTSGCLLAKLLEITTDRRFTGPRMDA
jgi:hypothetical protein